MSFGLSPAIELAYNLGFDAGTLDEDISIAGILPGRADMTSPARTAA